MATGAWVAMVVVEVEGAAGEEVERAWVRTVSVVVCVEMAVAAAEGTGGVVVGVAERGRALGPAETVMEAVGA